MITVPRRPHLHRPKFTRGLPRFSAGTVTVTWTTSASATDLYSVPVIFESTAVAGDLISKIKIGSAYKNIIDGWVAVDSNSSGSPDVWKKIELGKIAQGRGSVTTSWKTVFKDGA